MVFSSPLFLFGFLPLFLGLYWATPAGLSNLAALLASLLFYAWGEPRFVAVAIASALFDFVVVRCLAGTHRRSVQKFWVGVGVSANLGLLVYFKYANFAAENAAALAGRWLGVQLPALAPIALPIGVSFIVFEKITYIVDVYRGAGEPAKRIRDYLLYVFLFPKLLAGPIIKYHDIEQQLVTRAKRFDDLAEGLPRFAFGLAKKVLLADPMSELADAIFAPGPTIGCGVAWLGAAAFALQIYFDFSGYSDMAIGLARIMGFRLMENFKQPYLATGFGDFWRRWHISLSTWIRDYLYVPLGGDRVRPIRLYVNLWICFLASALWHGAAWTYVAWGAYHGVFLTLDRIFIRRLLGRLPRSVGITYTFLAVTIGWVLFRAPDLPAAGSYLAAMFDIGRSSDRLVLVSRDLYLVLVLDLMICFLPAVAGWQLLLEKLRSVPQWRMLVTSEACAFLLLSLAKTTTASFQPFLYFRF